MALRTDRREWDALARADAMWAICSNEDDWSSEAFLRTGEEEVGRVLAGLEAHGLPVPSGAALDFGCGLGRLTVPLAHRIGSAIGVDISSEMVQRARALHADDAAVEFRVNAAPDLRQFADQSFAFVLSLITLQHVSSPELIAAYLAEFARVLTPGGLIVVQIPTAVAARVRWHPLRVLNRAARRLPGLPASVSKALLPWSTRLTALPEARVRGVLEASGAPVRLALPDQRTGSDAVPSRIYVAGLEPPRG